MITCIIVDDEQICIDILCSHIQKVANLSLIATFQDPVEALESVSSSPVDLIFLDIDMPRFSGLDFIETLKSNSRSKFPHIILATSHAEHAMKGFDHGVTDYLLKPITLQRFLVAIERLKTNSGVITQPKKESTFLFVESEGKKVKIDFADILYIEAAGNYVKLITQNGNHIIYSSMSAIQTQLPESDFSRIHNSFIIAISKIQSVAKNEVFLSDGEKPMPFPIGPSFKEALFKKLKIQ